MYKIRSVSFINHPVLGNLSLDFCDFEGNAVDTIIIAGENGTGKSTVMDSIYKLVSRIADFEANVEYEENGTPFTIAYEKKPIFNGDLRLYANDGKGFNSPLASDQTAKRYPTVGIYSDVDINFHANILSSVTSLILDEKCDSRRSSSNLPTQINQLLIDIQALDDAAVAREVRAHQDSPLSKLTIEERMPRFTTAFNRMFDDLAYSHVDNINGHKVILFRKNGVDIPIDALSSGEKQVVYRGCFLLKDANAMNGAFVFIDEPEISLHPTWQSKIMDYYKGMFTNSLGMQTSQIFCVTHSPFVIHNECRKNDKVIVLFREENGCIAVKDRPEYFKCDSVEAVQDAFSINNFVHETPTVYLEGRTDEAYFTKALEVFGFDPPFKFKWVGHLDDKGQEVYTGSSSLEKAHQFLIGLDSPVRSVCLFDCDTKKHDSSKNNAYSITIPTYDNSKNISKGIENALVLDSIEDMSPFYAITTKIGDYGERKDISEFKKMEFCRYICAMDDDSLQMIFSNLIGIIDRLMRVFNGD